ncbi:MULTISPECIES: carboxymuconolactone decarboxylase family protein [Chelativorans]|uniref:Carboxymuconolactone decarboxylase n=1 Tax=Chelativorans sp. (strain BNC1) TaxID=266779 RepID=Q11K70_CHESB|nr:MULTISPECIES: carboxymuconolactone decarboxylase family protein [Chelativorans]
MSKRLPHLTIAEMSDEQKRIYDRMAAGRARGVAGPLMAYLRNPELAEIALQLSEFCRKRTSLPMRLSELAILITVAEWRSGFQWHGHEKLALESGIDQAVIDAIRRGVEPAFAKADEAALYRFVTELLREKSTSDRTFKNVSEYLDRRALVELISILGYYIMGAMEVRAFAEKPGGKADPFCLLQGEV